MTPWCETILSHNPTQNIFIFTNCVKHTTGSVESLSAVLYWLCRQETTELKFKLGCKVKKTHHVASSPCPKSRSPMSSFSNLLSICVWWQFDTCTTKELLTRNRWLLECIWSKTLQNKTKWKVKYFFKKPEDQNSYVHYTLPLETVLVLKGKKRLESLRK